VFGFSVIPFEGMPDYAAIEVDGSGVGGIGAISDELPAEVPAHWKVYFSVANADEAVAKAESLGARVVMQPQDMPYGRHAEIVDPTGALVALLQNPPPSA
jgi:hypothetical protein